MATASPASVDAISSDDRKVIVSALELQAQSIVRYIRSAKSDAIQQVYEKELHKVQALRDRFL